MEVNWTGWDLHLFWRVVHWTLGAYAGGWLARKVVGVRCDSWWADWLVGVAGGVLGILLFTLLPFDFSFLARIPYEVNIVPFFAGALILLGAGRAVTLLGGRLRAAPDPGAHAGVDEALAEIWRRREAP